MCAQGYSPRDRRPIAARRLRASQSAAHWLAGRGVTANAISLLGLCCGLLAGVAFSLTGAWPAASRLWWLAAAAFVQLRLVANMLDGMVAIESATASPVGELYNEVPDRISDCATLVGLGYAAGGQPELGYLAALAAVFTAYVRTAGRSAGAPQEFCGPMAKQQRMFLVTIVAVYLAVTPASWQPWLAAPIAGGLPAIALALIFVGCALTSLRRLLRIAASLRQVTP
jgi:phosphatidylglycerophosphate synthase